MDPKIETNDDSQALTLKVNKLREERNARQTARLQLLKSLHLQKVPRESLYLSASESSIKAPAINKKSEFKSVSNVKSKDEDDSHSHHIAASEFNLILSKSKKIERKHKQIIKSTFPGPAAKINLENKLISSDPIEKLPFKKEKLKQIDVLAMPKQLDQRKYVKFSSETKFVGVSNSKTNDPLKKEASTGLIKPKPIVIRNPKIQMLHNPQTIVLSGINKQAGQKPLPLMKNQTSHNLSNITIAANKNLPANRFDQKQIWHGSQASSTLNNFEIPIKKSIVNKRQTLKSSQVPTALMNKEIPFKKPAVNKRHTLHISQASAAPVNSLKILPKKSTADRRQTLNNSRATAVLKNVDVHDKLAAGKRHTLHSSQQPVAFEEVKNNDPKFNKTGLRRSLSTVHFKRLGHKAANECFKRTFSSGAIKYKEIEEELPNEFPPKDYILPVESEKKKSVSFFTPLSKNSTYRMVSNTPNPTELRKRLNDWLQKRGKSLSTYHHLKCFGLHSAHSHVKSPIHDNPIDDDDKENVEVDNDGSFNENVTGEIVDNAAECRSSITETNRTSIHHIPFMQSKVESSKNLTPNGQLKKSLDPLVSEALYDLSNLILEDYSWVQCAEWLRAIVRECGENIKNIPAYWECRAALEEKRGDFVRTFDCFQNALRQGAQPSNIDESLDNLLQKFMKLNLEPNLQCGQTDIPNQKLVDVKNVFKSSLIRFAIKQMNIDEENQSGNFPKQFTATPVRRSSRISAVNEKIQSHRIIPGKGEHKAINSSNKELSNRNTKEINAVTRSTQKERKHLIQLCESLRNVDDDIKQTLIFVPNKALNFNDCL